jgi:hypothetical protein
MITSRNTPFTWGRMLLVAFCLTLLATTLVQAADDAKPRSTTELKSDLRKSEQELKKMQDLQRKMKSAGRESSNSTRQKLSESLREHMVNCILRREDDLGMEHTIMKHGETTTSGTTSAAEAGAPVGTSSSKQTKNLYNMDGPNADRMRQMSRMQSIYVSTQKSVRSAVEKQSDAFDRYMGDLVGFEGQLQLWASDLQTDLDSREEADRKAKEDIENSTKDPDSDK